MGPLFCENFVQIELCKGLFLDNKIDNGIWSCQTDFDKIRQFLKRGMRLCPERR